MICSGSSEAKTCQISKAARRPYRTEALGMNRNLSPLSLAQDEMPDSASVALGDDAFDQVAKQINAHFERAEIAAESAKNHRISAGLLLCDLRPKVTAGFKWEAWLSEGLAYRHLPQPQGHRHVGFWSVSNDRDSLCLG
jgi:hypothetical protein